MSDENSPDEPKIDRPAVSGFKRAVEDQPADNSGGEQSGYSLQQKQADKSRAVDEDPDNASGFFKDAATGEESGFSLAGKDSGGGGFDLGPAATMSLFGGKWMFVHPNAYLSDQHTAHPKFEKGLNRSFDKMIKRAIQERWQGIILQQGIAGRIAAAGPLNRALNRRIAYLANPPPGHEKRARQAIEMMGFNPRNPEVMAQLQTLRSHAMSPEEVIRMTSTPPTSSSPSPTNP